MLRSPPARETVLNKPERPCPPNLSSPKDPVAPLKARKHAAPQDVEKTGHMTRPAASVLPHAWKCPGSTQGPHTVLDQDVVFACASGRSAPIDPAAVTHECRHDDQGCLLHYSRQP